MRLREARLRCSLSLVELSERTKIRCEQLAAIEEGKVIAGLEPVILRSFLRKYAKTVELDPQIILGLFEQSLHQVPPKRLTRFVLPVGLVAAVLIGVIGVFYVVRASFMSAVASSAIVRHTAAKATTASVAAIGSQQPSSVAFSVRSDPPGAIVLIDRIRLGVTPLSRVPVSAAESREVRLERPGYLTRVFNLDFTHAQQLNVRLERVPCAEVSPC